VTLVLPGGDINPSTGRQPEEKTMKAYRTRVLAVLAASVLTTSLSFGDRAQVATNQAVITSMYNTVQVRHGTAGWSDAKLNEVLKPTDAVRTGEDSRAELTIGRTGYIRLDENSHLLITHLDEAGTSSFKALIGGVWVTLAKALGGSSKFEVEMPSAVASVKGTVFRCDVDDEGDSSTYVYEGDVELRANDKRVKLTPAQWARVPRGLKKILLQNMNLQEDDQRPWVAYNRHRDILPHLGDPRIIVALTEGAREPGKSSFIASQALAGMLRRLGFKGASVTKADAGKLSMDRNGWLQWRQKPSATYCIVGKIATEPVRKLSNGGFSMQARGSAVLLQIGKREPLATVTSSASGIGNTAEKAESTALSALGARLGTELSRWIIRAVMSKQGQGVRIDFTGATREQIYALHMAARQSAGAARVVPVRMPAGRLSLVVPGKVQPAVLARFIQARLGNLAEDVKVQGQAIKVKFRSIPSPQRPKIKPGQRPGHRPRPGPKQRPRRRGERR